jgi:hypothetical protein
MAMEEKPLLVMRPTYHLHCPVQGCTTEHDLTFNINDMQGKSEQPQRFDYKPDNLKCDAHELTFVGELLVNGAVVAVSGQWVPLSKKKVCCKVVMILKSTNAGSADPIYVVHINRYIRKYPEPNEDPHHYLYYHYNEGTCPTNWLRGIKVIIHDQDTDPHGVFEVYKIIDEAQFYKLTGYTIDQLDANQIDCNKVGTVMEQIAPELFPDFPVEPPVLPAVTH